MGDAPKFAVGDRVRIIADSPLSAMDKLGRIVRVDDDHDGYGVDIPGHVRMWYGADEIVPAPVTSLSPLARWAFRNRRDWSLSCRDTFGNGSERIVYVRKAACTYNRWSDAWIPAPGFDAGTDELEIRIPKAASR